VRPGGIDAEADEFDDAVRSELPFDSQSTDQDTDGDQDAVVVPAGNELGQLVPTRREPIEDQQQVVGLEIGPGRFTAGASPVGELSVQIEVEVAGGSDIAPGRCHEA